MGRSLAQTTRGAVLTIATLALLGGGAVFVAGPGSEEMLRRSFSSALITDTAAVAAVRTAASAPVSGTEDYWLSTSARDEAITPAMRKVAVGDRISLTLAGENKTYEVATVRDAPPTLTRIDTSTEAGRSIIITAHDTDNATAGSVRFIIEYDGPRASTIRSIGGRAL